MAFFVGAALKLEPLGGGTPLDVVVVFVCSHPTSPPRTSSVRRDVRSVDTLVTQFFACSGTFSQSGQIMGMISTVTHPTTMFIGSPMRRKSVKR